MTHTHIEYHFSKKALVLAALFLVITITPPIFFIVISYQHNMPVSIIFSVCVLIILIITIPRFLLFLSMAIKNIPAIILTEKKLIDNINKREYKWQEIKEITYKTHKGKAPGGYTAIILNSSEKEISIPHNAIKCKTTQFLNDLICFHKQYNS